jgi:hypothetical protein
MPTMQDAILTLFGAYLAIEMLTGGLITILISEACKSDKPEAQERHVSWRVGALTFLIAIGLIAMGAPRSPSPQASTTGFE